MKKFIAAIATAIVSLTATAQTTEVFYSPVNDTMEIGLGFDRQSHKCILSVIEESKKDVNFTFDIVNEQGDSKLVGTIDEGTLNVIPKTRKVNYYLCNYEITMPQLFQLVASSRHGEKVVINGQEIESDVLAKALNNISQEFPRMERPRHMRPHRATMS